MRSAETGFLQRSVAVGGTEYRYTVYVPVDFDPSRRWPVILFLHGVGERGTDGIRPATTGLGNAIRNAPERVPAVVVFPQVPEKMYWGGEPAGAALAALDASVAELAGDPDRIYLTGLSMGGYGAWHLALAHPDRWAAVVAVCGGLGRNVLPAPAARTLRHLPIRIYHGDADTIVPVSESRRIHEALLEEGADVHYTEYPGVGHDSWTRTYADPELWRWLFAQRRVRSSSRR
jgi:predicted peptidase